MKKLARLAAEVAGKRNDHRDHQLGAIGIRSDGAIVHARNLPSDRQNYDLHAEARLAQKLDVGAIVLVVRQRRDGTLGLAKPCKRCQARLRNRGVAAVYYSDNNEIKRLW